MKDMIELSELANKAIEKLRLDFASAGAMHMTEEQIVEMAIYFMCFTLANPLVLASETLQLSLASAKQVATNTAPPEYIALARAMILGEMK